MAYIEYGVLPEGQLNNIEGDSMYFYPNDFSGLASADAPFVLTDGTCHTLIGKKRLVPLSVAQKMPNLDSETLNFINQ